VAFAAAGKPDFVCLPDRFDLVRADCALPHFPEGAGFPLRRVPRRPHPDHRPGGGPAHADRIRHRGMAGAATAAGTPAVDQLRRLWLRPPGVGSYVRGGHSPAQPDDRRGVRRGNHQQPGGRQLGADGRLDGPDGPAGVPGARVAKV
ncbi:MAG: hypothetical protein AVDCRST_MAG56-2769, partial [uncultured Cytophagales bacterium]